MNPTPPGKAPVDVAARHQALIDQLKSEGHIRTAAVEAALRTVPRHLFVPGHPVEEVYNPELAIGIRSSDGRTTSDRADQPWKSSCSQPVVYPMLLEQLEVAHGHRVLEIGAGTGYNAALLAHLVGTTGQVTSMDIDEELVLSASKHLASAGFPAVRVVCGDGILGYPDGAPYDRIILTVGAWDIAPAWRDQLRNGGRLLVPLAHGSADQQVTMAYDSRAGVLECVSMSACTFMMMRGPHSSPVTSRDRPRTQA